METTLNSECRWRSLLHEALHSVSVGLTQGSYDQFAPWEEAIVETLQRIYRPLMLPRLNLNIPESRFLTIEKEWHYNKAIEGLAQIAAERPDISLNQFLEELLQVSLPDRPAYAFSWGRQATEFTRFKRVYASASGLLR